MLHHSSCLPLSFALLLLGAPLASAAIGDWVDGDHARMRLIASAPAPDGTVDAAIEIVLDPGWKTYWRSPGDAGIPPRLDFAGSVNAPDPAVDFPAPERDDDGFAATNVYHNRVVLPVRFRGANPAEALNLVLKADLGVCEEVCVPVSMVANIDVPSGEKDAEAADLIAAARAAVPGPGRPGSFEIDALKRVGGTDALPEFEVVATTGSGAEGVLFVETPPDWYPAPPKATGSQDGRTTYRFTVDRKSATTPIDDAQIALTLTEGGAATTRAFKLDGAVASP
ncbi:protein-disulfide reductase DsbD family protein [Kaistia dalseonensis]|uniref:Suppressor for copper-sensitivity B n=1 Tax=Kaistia dalseonensis TaxID=410840 RepID=A0ABU0HCP6_9HYPH|nr:protein-disulfide reductase DsbD domain-containing protein [Kaistia dalseonensis]MCX5497449.1 protein-disulfide reductase DsbD family protein [Kaistia dalseonensis]MDQ0440088.1 suppressor for copper-sensitivity B [Kaistia dalseonensis]